MHYKDFFKNFTQWQKTISNCLLWLFIIVNKLKKLFCLPKWDTFMLNWIQNLLGLVLRIGIKNFAWWLGNINKQSDYCQYAWKPIGPEIGHYINMAQNLISFVLQIQSKTFLKFYKDDRPLSLLSICSKSYQPRNRALISTWHKTSYTCSSDHFFEFLQDRPL